MWGPWSENLRGPAGQSGGFFGGISSGSSSGSSGGGNAAGVPLFIAEGDEFVAPANQQTLFAMPIDVEGMLVIDGFLVEVA